MHLDALTSPADMSGSDLSQLRPGKNKIESAAEQFESLLIYQMLKSAKPSGSSSLGGEEDQNSSLIDMGQQQFAQALASSGGLGIAKMIVTGLNHDAH
jgi:Rod binding domain-containing protein